MTYNIRSNSNMFINRFFIAATQDVNQMLKYLNDLWQKWRDKQKKLEAIDRGKINSNICKSM